MICGANQHEPFEANLIGLELSEIVRSNVNGTVHTLTTNSTGHISLAIELQPVDEQATTYQITATFNGTSPQTLNATAKNPYGMEYPICTTIQYGYYTMLKQHNNYSTVLSKHWTRLDKK